MAMVASPSAAATVQSAPPPPASSCSPPQFHVLAVDDSLLDRKLIEGLLRTSSCHVTAVDSVTKALEFLGMQQQQQHVGGGGGTTTAAAVPSCSYCHRQEINLIITDYCMPGMTGYDLLKTVKGSGSPLRDIPVVIMSSENVPARINRCLEEGADDFFLKPVKLSDVSKLRPHLLRGKPTPSNDQAEGTSRGQDLQGPLRLDDLGQDQLCADVVVADADLAAATDNSPRSSNKRKAPPAPPQGLAVAGGSIHLLDQRTRTTTCCAGYAMPLA